MTPLRVALFVEGSHTPPPTRGERPLVAIWQALAESLGLSAFHLIIPISKKHLVAMDPANPKMSGASEGLDQLMTRTLRSTPFDAAVVAWDLVPDWNSTGHYCRWQETLDLFRLLGASEALPEPWRQKAARRHAELTSRSTPGDRPEPTRLSQQEVLALCMEPMFEALLTLDEHAIRDALGLKTRPRGWPTPGWGVGATLRPDTEVLAPAVRAARGVRPRLTAVKRVPGDLRTNKDGWGEFLLRQMLDHEAHRPLVLGHPISVRLREYLG
ncbi:MAG: hypothetical protein H6739_11125 [Alphaproteobacteria bacterium]|nr:hypothetical protein [Alphaproteobacteria bacterium]